jgi:hypothetical protein
MITLFERHRVRAQGSRRIRENRFVKTGPGRQGESEMTDTIVASMVEDAPADADACFERGMMYSSGRDVAVDMIEAHKWFNIAAMRGKRDATGLRREIAEQMSDAEIGAAQRAARDWLKANSPLAIVEDVRAAA